LRTSRVTSQMHQLPEAKNTVSPGPRLPRDNQGETAASIRMRRRGWTDGARA
jgi:hypothetical protein